jgi:hypothetical protein
MKSNLAVLFLYTRLLRQDSRQAGLETNLYQRAKIRPLIAIKRHLKKTGINVF